MHSPILPVVLQLISTSWPQSSHSGPYLTVCPHNNNWGSPGFSTRKEHFLMSWSLAQEAAVLRAPTSSFGVNCGRKLPSCLSSLNLCSKSERPEPNVFLRSPEFKPWTVNESLHTIIWEKPPWSIPSLSLDRAECPTLCPSPIQPCSTGTFWKHCSPLPHTNSRQNKLYVRKEKQRENLFLFFFFFLMGFEITARHHSFQAEVYTWISKQKYSPKIAETIVQLATVWMQRKQNTWTQSLLLWKQILQCSFSI